MPLTARADDLTAPPPRPARAAAAEQLIADVTLRIPQDAIRALVRDELAALRAEIRDEVLAEIRDLGLARWVDVNGAADFLGMTPKAFANQASRGLWPRHRENGTYWYRLDELDRARRARAHHQPAVTTTGDTA